MTAPVDVTYLSRHETFAELRKMVGREVELFVCDGLIAANLRGTLEGPTPEEQALEERGNYWTILGETGGCIFGYQIGSSYWDALGLNCRASEFWGASHEFAIWMVEEPDQP